MTDECNNPILVRAKYTFKGKNNDELTFAKGNIITITQKLDGGWWEGTLYGKTGWFPSNYVVDYKPDKPTKSPVNGTTKSITDGIDTSTGQEMANRSLYRNMILRNMLESEKEHVRELTQILDLYLKPLRTEAILTDDEYQCLVGNLEHILQFQLSFLKTLEEHVKKSHKDQRVGGEFMRAAPTLKTLLTIYCENHPVAVETLNRRRELLTAFIQRRDADIMVLITGLSRPFRHLEKYPSMLRELERNTDESHPDRGDTQRSIAVYRDITKVAVDTRKQKEMQLELLSGTINDWEGEPLNTMGDIIHMGTIQVKNDDSDKEDCCLVLLTGVLLVLRISFQLNTYVFKRKIKLNGACVKKLTEMKLSNGTIFTQVLELQPALNSNGNTKSLILLFTNNEESNKWLELFQYVDGVTLDDSCVTISPTTPVQYATVQSSVSPMMKPHFSTLPAPGQAEVLKKASNNVLISSCQNGENNSASNVNGTKRILNGHFRPLAPQRILPSWNCGKNVKLRKKDLIGQVFDEEETELLKIVESYCLSDRTRPLATVRPNANSPHLIVAEDEKIFVEELIGDEMVVQERTLVDTVYTLKDQIGTLRQEMKNLSKSLESEQKARRHLEELVWRYIPQRNSSNAISKQAQSQENGLSTSITITPQM